MLPRSLPRSLARSGRSLFSCQIRKSETNSPIFLLSFLLSHSTPAELGGAPSMHANTRTDGRALPSPLSLACLLQSSLPSSSFSSSSPTSIERKLLSLLKYVHKTEEMGSIKRADLSDWCPGGTDGRTDGRTDEGRAPGRRGIGDGSGRGAGIACPRGFHRHSKLLYIVRSRTYF